MNKKVLLFGAIPALLVAAGFFVLGSKGLNGKYEQRLSSHLVNGDDPTIEGLFDFYHMLKGDFTKEDWERSQELAKNVDRNRSSFSWIDQGPDNIGGRTRAIVVDHNNINHVYAGSVSGGLFESINRGNTWQKVETFTENLAVSSMCQTADGTFYVATGHLAEKINGAFESGAHGYGVFYSNEDGTWTRIPGTESYTYINEIVADEENNQVWIASSHGLIKYDPATSDLTTITAFTPSGGCNSLSISKDGLVIVGHAISGGPPRTMVSTDGGNTFNQVSETGEEEGKISMSGVTRIEYAISHERVDGNYRVYASAANNSLRGVWRSSDDGMTWSRIAPAYDGTPGGFAPFSPGSAPGQGEYDNIISVVPGAPDRIYLGGIDCYTWSTTGNWEQISQWFLSPTNPNYVHADNHEFVWDSWGRLYIGNDGGVSFCDNAASADPEFHPANRGYNVTQFFAIGASGSGDVIGGTQDNGTMSNYHEGTTWQEHNEMNPDYFGGDGFSADISFINKNLLFASVYAASVRRSSDKGGNGSYFIPSAFFAPGSPCTPGATDDSGCGQFFTKFEMWEDPNDLASEDTILYIASESFSIGDIIDVPSATSQTTIPYECPINIVFDDTLNANPDLTFDDIIVVDEITGDDFNLGVLDWEFIYGGDIISEGDSLLINGVEESDTVIVESWTTIDHYIGTNPLKPGLQVDMGNDSILYNIAWDTLKIQDIKQSWFALEMGGANGIWMTRNALRFSAPDQGWFMATDQIAEDVTSMEFSKNGDYLFIGTRNGRLFRISGFNTAYTPTGVADDPTLTGGTRIDTLFDLNGEPHIIRSEHVYTFTHPVTSIASGALDNADHLVVTLGQFSGGDKVQECLNATGESLTFESLDFPETGDGAAASGIPCYASLIDRDNPNIILIGTEFGIFATENGGDEWTNVSGDFGNTPIYDIEQNWRTWDEGCKRPGEIYIGTHGRGIWSTSDLLSTNESNDGSYTENALPNINLFPNPVQNFGTVEFNLQENEDVTLQIFNLSGKLVYSAANKDLQAGKNRVEFDTQELPKGTYILRLSSSSMNETVKFVKH